ncbi:DUF3307 domain-containing protein [Kitasatospora kifunensis]|uniref:DUF3307 domain-containing protein n=1 Tax=Kitasatospora kifunensis TaxID=58351 RepID=A0A7W7VTG4_KITKI|nr:DUF3307 domain-containing protein [Kitasatospora kifunensis]MBB4922212.1 hypothetical protein [Kitasatospora kifunensis]
MFADFFVILFAAHHLSDYPLQTDYQALHKADRTATGWRANLAHAGTHVTTSAVLLWLGILILDLHASAAGTVAALAWIGCSHSLIDRRWPVRWWMEHTGQTSYLANGGAQYVDQAFHIGLGLLPAAVTLAAM